MSAMLLDFVIIGNRDLREGRNCSLSGIGQEPTSPFHPIVLDWIGTQFLTNLIDHVSWSFLRAFERSALGKCAPAYYLGQFGEPNVSFRRSRREVPDARSFINGSSDNPSIIRTEFCGLICGWKLSASCIGSYSQK